MLISRHLVDGWMDGDVVVLYVVYAVGMYIQYELYVCIRRVRLSSSVKREFLSKNEDDEGRISSHLLPFNHLHHPLHLVSLPPSCVATSTTLDSFPAFVERSQYRHPRGIQGFFLSITFFLFFYIFFFPFFPHIIILDLIIYISDSICLVLSC